MGRLGLKVSNESTDIVWILYYHEKVQVGGLYYEVANVYWVHMLSRCEAAFYDGFAQGVCEQEQPFLHTEGDEQDTAVGVVFE